MSEQGMEKRVESELMRVGIGTYKPLTDESLRFMRQLGVKDVLLAPHRHSEYDSVMSLDEVWTKSDLREHQEKIQAAGLELYAIEKLPIPLYDILIEEEDKEEKIGIVKETIRNMGEVNIPVLGYSGHPPIGAVRTDKNYSVRGGAITSAFNQEDLDEDNLGITDQEFTEEELWESYEEFLTEVLPVAEEAGVEMGVHPSDPPVEQLGGLPMLFRNRENFKRALELVPSENHGLKLCLGCWSQMGEDLPDVIHEFGKENIIYVHFRDVVGTVPSFHETFINDEESNYDEYQVMKALSDIGFDGVLAPDHVPVMEGDTDWGFVSPLGQSYTAGYLKGMLNCINRED